MKCCSCDSCAFIVLRLGAFYGIEVSFVTLSAMSTYGDGEPTRRDRTPISNPTTRV